jgi:hypothetical protein
MPSLRLDWWYDALPALRSHYQKQADLWGFGDGDDDKETVWDAGLRVETDLLSTWKAPDQLVTPTQVSPLPSMLEE